jgi:hypothetical protein
MLRRYFLHFRFSNALLNMSSWKAQEVGWYPFNLITLSGFGCGDETAGSGGRSEPAGLS